MATYDLAYPGAAIDAILNTAYFLQEAGYIFQGSASEYSGTPSKRVWLIAPAGSTGFGLSSAVPQGSFGICLYNGTAWVGKVINVLTLDSAPTRNSQNGVTSGGVAATLDEIAGGIMETFASLLFDDETASADLRTKLSYAVKFSVSDVYQTVTHLNILAATTSKAGLMSAEDKAKVDSFLTNLRSLTFADTTASADQATQITETLKATIGGVQEVIDSITLLAATSSKAGLLSASDKAYIDALPATLTSLSNSISGALALMQSLVGYYVCDTAAATAAKTVTATGYTLTNGGCIRIKMTNANTAANVTLNINSTGAKALYYDGAQASSTNTWEAGEVLEVYYDGTQYQCASGGGGKFASGEKVKEVSITDTLNNTTALVESAPVKAAVDNVLANIGYYVCDTAAATVAKVVAANGYKLTQGGNIRIKMTNTNTANNVTLNINSTGAKPLYYNGIQASSANSWDAGEIVIAYYDGTKYLCMPEVPKANNVKYDASFSGLNSQNVQGAIDEMVEKIGLHKQFSIAAVQNKYSYVTLPIEEGKRYKIKVTLDSDAVQDEKIIMSTSAADNGTGVSNQVGIIPAGSRSLIFTLDVDSSNVTKKNLKANKWGANYNVAVDFESITQIQFYTNENVGDVAIRHNVSKIPINTSDWSMNLLSAKGIGIPDWTWVKGKAFTTSGTETASGTRSYCKFNAKAGDVLKLRVWQSFTNGYSLLITKVDDNYSNALTYQLTRDWVEHYYMFTVDCEAYINIDNTVVEGAEILLRSRDAMALIGDTIAARSDKTIYVAASNSSSKDKFYSDFVCTGTNDEVVINKALSVIFGPTKVGGTLILRTGDYYFDAITSNNSFVYMSFGATYNNMGIEIKGEHPSMSLNDKGVAGACIHITKTAYELLDPTIQYSVFKVVENTWRHKLVFDELTIKCYWNQRKIIGINAGDFQGAIKVLNTQLYCYDNYQEHGEVTVGNPPDLAVDGSIGIKMCCMNSPNGTYGNNYENVSVSGFYEGFAVCGEHVFMKECATFFCNYGYTFQRYGGSNNTAGNNEHTTVLIKCIDERNRCGPKFFNKNPYNSYGQGIVIIGFSFEHASNITPGNREQGTLACESVPGRFCGEITYTIGGFGGMNVSNTVDRPFWEHGHGQRFKTRNLCQDLACTSDVRNSYAPNYLQHIYDTTLNKEVICIDTPTFAKVELSLTRIATDTGTLSIILGGKTYSITLTSASYTSLTEMAADIAYLFRMQKVNCYNDGATIHFDDVYLGNLTSASFNPRSTGVEGTVTITNAGTNAVWVDAMGNEV